MVSRLERPWTFTIITYMSQQITPKAYSTSRPNNSFTTSLYLKVSEEGTLYALDRRRRKSADYEVKLTIEYPSYEAELQMKQRCTRYDEVRSQHIIDYDLLTEERVRRCLVNWTMHEAMPFIFPSGMGKLHRYHGELDDESLDLWKGLSPTIRKSVAWLINEAIGLA